VWWLRHGLACMTIRPVPRSRAPVERHEVGLNRESGDFILYNPGNGGENSATRKTSDKRASTLSP
jgi:hypothetical protein